jgi:Ca2+/Na+ antiporter
VTSFLSVLSEVGVGTIVGSAVFNVLFVIGACAFASTKVRRPRSLLSCLRAIMDQITIYAPEAHIM